MTQIAIDPNNGSLGLNLAGDAVVNPGGRVIWDVDPSANVTWINILPKKSQEDVWDSDTLHGNSGGWTGKIKNKNYRGYIN